MLRRIYRILHETADDFMGGESFTRGAAIAFYSVTSLVPVLIIVIAIASIVFGEDAARGALVSELGTLLGRPGAQLIEAAISSAYASGSDLTALLFGAGILVVTATGVFAELQAALNAIWGLKAQPLSILRLLRDRVAGLGLIVALGFLLLVSLVIDTGIAATSGYIDAHLMYGATALRAFNVLTSYALTVFLFAAIYKVLPDVKLNWREVVFGAFVTALAFQGGRALIGLYLGRSTVISSYGAAGALASMLLWIYYSSQIFLVCAAFTKAVFRPRA
jgi:membrane protein